MLEQATKVKCPLCEGQGELSPAEVVERFVNPEQHKRLDDQSAEIAETVSIGTTEAKGKVLNFQKEVHNWNPALPIWRRSPKE